MVFFGLSANSLRLHSTYFAISALAIAATSTGPDSQALSHLLILRLDTHCSITFTGWLRSLTTYSQAALQSAFVLLPVFWSHGTTSKYFALKFLVTITTLTSATPTAARATMPSLFSWASVFKMPAPYA